MFNGKKIIVLGDRDGIPSPAIEECVKRSGGEVIFASTECMVWTTAGAMDLENQGRIKELAEQYEPESILVILGSADGSSTQIWAETVTVGDPTYVGPLSGAQLGLKVFHALEKEFKEAVNAEVYEEQISMMEMVLPVDEIVETVTSIRNEHSKY